MYEGLGPNSGLEQTKQILWPIALVFQSTARVVSRKKCAFARKWDVKSRFWAQVDRRNPEFYEVRAPRGHAAASGSGQFTTFPEAEEAEAAN